MVTCKKKSWKWIESRIDSEQRGFKGLLDFVTFENTCTFLNEEYFRF